MNSITRVLIVDDEAAIRRFLRASFDPKAIELQEAENGLDAIRQVALFSPDVVLLDLGLPDMDGIEVVRRLREWTLVPIIVLSARGKEIDKVSALDVGADDYLTKPFGINELMARIRAATRRDQLKNSGTDESIVSSFGIKIDLSTRQIWKNNIEVHLTPIEYRLLACLAKNAGFVLTHRQLLLEAWGPEYEFEGHYLRVYMGQLRHKLEDNPAQPKLITTEPGVGYRLRQEE